MPTEHVDIPDGERHEPKGADTATSGQVYVSDGANSGAWSKPSAANTTVADSAGWYAGSDVEAVLAEIYNQTPGGWGYYKDDGASGQVINTSATKLSINGLGSATDTASLPLAIRGTDHLWDTAADRITPILENDSYDFRLDLPITAKSGSPSELTIQLDISSSSTPTTVIVEHFFDTGKTAPYTLSFGVPLFVGSTFIANGGQIFLTVDTGTVTITAPAITLVRSHNGNM